MVVFENVSKSFGEKSVLENVSVHIKPGEICGICGRNGSGKSVFIKMAAGMMYPCEGKIRIGGKLLKKGEFPEDTGIVLDNIGFIRDKSGYYNLKLLASILKKADDARIREVMDYVGLRIRRYMESIHWE